MQIIICLRNKCAVQGTLLHMSNQLEFILRQWAKERSVSFPASEDNGKHYLLFDQKHEVAFSQTGQNIRMEAELGDFPGNNRTAKTLLDTIMSLQLARARKHAEILSLEAAAKRLYLHVDVNAEALDLHEFNCALSSFINGMAFWTEKIERATGSFVSRPAPMAMMYP